MNKQQVENFVKINNILASNNFKDKFTNIKYILKNSN